MGESGAEPPAKPRIIEITLIILDIILSAFKKLKQEVITE